jgi:hypothetical protein
VQTALPTFEPKLFAVVKNSNRSDWLAVACGGGILAGPIGSVNRLRSEFFFYALEFSDASYSELDRAKSVLTSFIRGAVGSSNLFGWWIGDPISFKRLFQTR